MWDVYVQSQQPLDNVTVDNLAEQMLIALQAKPTAQQLAVLEGVLDDIIAVAEEKP